MSVTLTGFAQQWEWARKVNNLTNNYSFKIYPCGNSGFYLTGSYDDSLSIDGHTIYADTNLRYPGISQLSAFLGKFDISGQCLWLKNTFYSMDACTDAASNIYISGFFSGQIILDGDTLHSTGNNASVIAKISSYGNLLNLEKVDGNGTRCQIELNSSNQLIVASAVFDSAYYKGHVFKDSTGLVLKLDSSLNLLQYSQSNAFSLVVQLELDMNDSIYMVVNKSYPCMYCGVCKIIKYSPNLTLLIDHYYTGGVDTHYYSDPYIVSHTDGNLYVFKYNSYSYPTVMKYNSQLNMLWSKSPDWGGWLYSKNNKLFLVGATWGMNCIDSIKKSSIISELDTSLNCLGYKALPLDNLLTGPGPFFGSAFADDFNNIYVTGVTDRPTVFDSSIISGTTNARASFIAKLKFDAVPDAVKNYNTEEVISIFPNPTSGIFTISFNNQTMEAKIRVYDVLGNSVLTEVHNDERNQEIDLSNQRKGIYFIEVIGDDERIVKKVAVE